MENSVGTFRTDRLMQGDRPSQVTVNTVLHKNNIRKKKHVKNEQTSRDAAANKRANTSGVGKSNNYYEDIYIPPYSNTH